jgi:hypothetical protein
MGEVVKGLDGLEFETNTMIIMVIPQLGRNAAAVRRY